MKAKILIVDDSGLARRSTRRILEGAGYEVIEAEDGGFGDLSLSNHAWVGSGALMWKIAGPYRLYAAVSQGFRASEGSAGMSTRGRAAGDSVSALCRLGGRR